MRWPTDLNIKAKILKFIHDIGGVLIVFSSKFKNCSLEKCINYFEKWKLRAEGELKSSLELPKNGKPLPFAQHLVILGTILNVLQKVG